VSGGAWSCVGCMVARVIGFAVCFIAANLLPAHASPPSSSYPPPITILSTREAKQRERTGDYFVVPQPGTRRQRREVPETRRALRELAQELSARRHERLGTQFDAESEDYRYTEGEEGEGEQDDDDDDEEEEEEELRRGWGGPEGGGGRRREREGVRAFFDEAASGSDYSGSEADDDDDEEEAAEGDTEELGGGAAAAGDGDDDGDGGTQPIVLLSDSPDGSPAGEQPSAALSPTGVGGETPGSERDAIAATQRMARKRARQRVIFDSEPQEDDEGADGEAAGAAAGAAAAAAAAGVAAEPAVAAAAVALGDDDQGTGSGQEEEREQREFRDQAEEEEQASVRAPQEGEQIIDRLEALRRQKQEADERGDKATAAALNAAMKPLREQLRLVPFAFDKK